MIANGVRRSYSACKRPKEIVAAAVAVDVDVFADEVEAADEFALHVPADIGAVDAAVSDLRAVEAERARDGQREIFYRAGNVASIGARPLYYRPAELVVQRTREQLGAGIAERRLGRDVAAKAALGYPRSELLSGTLHNQLGRAIIKRAGPDTCDIARTVKNFTLPVTGTLGFDSAQVTHGGINCADIGGDMQSKLVRGLYLVGEYVDVDGDCGGYNLLWAFASGVRAANAICDQL